MLPEWLGNADELEAELKDLLEKKGLDNMDTSEFQILKDYKDINPAEDDD